YARRFWWRQAFRTRVRLPPPPPFDSARSCRSEPRSWRAIRLKAESKGQQANFLNSIRVVIGAPFVYILRCVDGSLYVGHTDDLNARVASHNAGLAALFTTNRR